MSTKTQKLIAKREKLMKEIVRNIDFIRGSITRVIRNGKSGGEFYHLTYKDENQKTHTKYIPSILVDKGKKGIGKMKKTRRLIAEISKINIEILKLAK